MRRRQPVEPEREASEEVMPHRVAWAGRQGTVLAELAESGRDAGDYGDAYAQVRRRQLADAEAWCAERGVSAARSIHGRRDPSDAEAAAGRTAGAGPHWQARLAREARR